MHAMPVMLGILCLMAIAYRYYSAFLAAKVATLNDLRETPAVRLNDHANYHPTNKWVLFGHHFAAISGAGPLIGPVLAAQFGYLPGLLWIVIGVCLGGAVQDFLVLVASMRRNGKSLGQIALQEVGKVGGSAATAAILFIIIIALAGLGKVVVKALGGEKVNYNVAGTVYSSSELKSEKRADGKWDVSFGTGTVLAYDSVKGARTLNLSRGMKITTDQEPKIVQVPAAAAPEAARGQGATAWSVPAPKGTLFFAPGSAWGTFTIACTIPIALFVGLYMYKIRKGRVVEASLIGAALTIGATVVGGFIPGSPLEHWFNLQDKWVVVAMAAYGFIASVLPVWVLLCPRDYLSSFLKIGTIGLLVIGTLVANPNLEAPAFNSVFAGGGPVVGGKIFPFLFITIMCGAISGFHALVSSGTTPKMVSREGHARVIGYGAMLIEGLVGVTAMIAAATLDKADYYAMNTELAKVPEYHDKFAQIGADVDHLNVAETRTEEALRGRTGGAVTLAVGFAHIFDKAAGRFFVGGGEAALSALWKYWYHFAIMFEALFILTTIDTGTRIGRFLVQEVAGKLHPKLGQTDWVPGAWISTAIVVVGWAWFIDSNNFDTVWKMFGIANQMLAVIALAIVSACLFNEGKARYLWVTMVPMAVVLITTTTAGIDMLATQWNTWRAQMAKPQPDGNLLFNAALLGILILAMLLCAFVVIGASLRRILSREPRKPGVELAPASA